MKYLFTKRKNRKGFLKLSVIENVVYEHSEQARAPHTNGPRDVPRCGALSLIQETLLYKGG